MMPPDLDRFFVGLIIVCVAIGVLIGGALFIGVPALWSAIAPWLHVVTRP